MRPRFDSVLLIAFGGPTRAEEIRPFLANVARGRNIPPERVESVAHHYDLIGGLSPLNELTFRQARALAERLATCGETLPVFVGMRNWHPFLHETLADMARAGCRRALGIILSAQRSEAGWDRYESDVAAARAATGPPAPDVVFAPPWSGHPGFTGAVADRLRTALDGVPAGVRPHTHVVFTAHSIPVPMSQASAYAEQVEEAARQVAESVGPAQWTVAYQSRTGNPRDPWLEPDVNDHLRDLARGGVRSVAVSPIGFVSDHVEVLYDLDVEARATARQLGIAFARAEALNDHPAFIRLLADVVAAGGTGDMGGK